MAALQKPALAPHLLARYLPGEGLFLVSEHGSDVLVGGAFGVLLPLLTGSLSVDEILDQASYACSEAEVLYALELLNANGHLVDGPPRPGGQEGYWSARKTQAPGRKVCIVNHTAQSDTELAELLSAQGVPLDSEEGLRVVLVDDYLDPALKTQNDSAIATGQPWMLVKPTGNILWLGPIFVPGKTGCWECLSHRLRLNRRVLGFLEHRLDTKLRLPTVSAPITRALAAAMAANEIVQWLCAETSSLVGALRTLDTISHALESQALTKRPQCASCGAKLAPPGPIPLEEAPQELASRDGGLRSRTAAEVYESLKQHVGSLLGVVPQLSPIRTGDDGIHVYISGQNLGATGGTLSVLAKTVRSRCSGKGITDIQARTSALCESIERYATVFQGHEPHILASLEELGEQAIAANACMLYSDRQYTQREARNVGADAFNRIPKPLPPQARLWWSPVWSLPEPNREPERKYLPTAYLYFHSEALRDPIGVSTCPPDSNGVATGSTYAEAVLQGLLELIERDAVALWWYPRTTVPRVELESFGSDFLNHCVQYHHKIGRELWVLDVTSDLGIPAFAGVSRKRSGEQQIIMGFGAHPDARIAVERAVAETNQLLSGVEVQLRNKESQGSATTRWLRTATVEKESYLQGQSRQPARAAGYPAAPQSVSEALRRCLDAVRRAGLRVYALDLTRPDIELKVVRVLCPGLRHFWARHAPGRLYDVPLALGLVERRLKEEELNPTAMFL